MKKVRLIILMAAAAFLPACRGESAAPAMSPLSESQKALITDSQSAFCIVDNAGLWSLDEGRLSRTTGIDLGERLTLQGKLSTAVFSQKKREIQLISTGGEEGWMRADQIAAASILSVVTSNAIPVYTQPRLSAISSRTIPSMTVIAIAVTHAASDFITVSCYDEEAQNLLRGVIIRNTGISASPGDVESAILYRVAMRTENPVMKKTLLSSAMKDYPDSAFADVIREALESAQSETATE